VKLGFKIMPLAAKRPPTSVFSNFLPSGIRTYQPYKVLRWKQHK